MAQQTRREQFLAEINEALDNGPYRHEDKNLHQIYSMALLRELLLYSAIDLMEVRRHIQRLSDPEFHRAKKRPRR